MATGHNPNFSDMTGSFGPFTIRQRGTRKGRQTVLAARVTHNASKTDKQAQVREQMTLRAELWHSLTPVNARSWVRCGAGMRDPEKKRGVDKLSGYNCFQAINAVRQSLSLPPLLSAPTLPFYLPDLGEVSINAAGAEEQDAGSFSLTLHAEAQAGPYEKHDGPFLVFAAPADLGGRQVMGRNRFTLLCAVSCMGPEGVDLSREFAAAHGAARGGERVCLRVVPVTAEGFAGRGRVVMCDVSVAVRESVACESVACHALKGEAKEGRPAGRESAPSFVQQDDPSQPCPSGRGRRGPGVLVLRGRRGRRGVLLRTVKGAAREKQAESSACNKTNDISYKHETECKPTLQRHVVRIFQYQEDYLADNSGSGKSKQRTKYRVSQIQRERAHGKKALPTPP